MRSVRRSYMSRTLYVAPSLSVNELNTFRVSMPQWCDEYVSQQVQVHAMTIRDRHVGYAYNAACLNFSNYIPGAALYRILLKL